jgi:hypothetical protein
MFALIYKIEKKEFHVGTYNFGFFLGGDKGIQHPQKQLTNRF